MINITLEDLTGLMDWFMQAQEEIELDTVDDANEIPDDDTNGYDSAQLGALTGDPTQAGGLFPQDALLLS